MSEELSAVLNVPAAQSDSDAKPAQDESGSPWGDEPTTLDEGAFQAGISKLAEFSSVLSSALSSLGKSVHSIEGSMKATLSSMDAMKLKMSEHEVRLSSRSRPGSSPSRPMSSRRRPRSGAGDVGPPTVLVEMTDEEIAEDLLEKEKVR